MEDTFKTGFTVLHTLATMHRRCRFCDPKVVGILTLAGDRTFMDAPERESLVAEWIGEAAQVKHISEMFARQTTIQNKRMMVCEYESDLTEQVPERQVATNAEQIRDRLDSVGVPERTELAKAVLQLVVDPHFQKGPALDYCYLFNAPDALIALSKFWLSEIEDLRADVEREGKKLVLIAGSRYALPIACVMSLCAMAQEPDKRGPLPVFAPKSSGTDMGELEEVRGRFRAVVVDVTVRSGLVLNNIVQEVERFGGDVAKALLLFNMRQREVALLNETVSDADQLQSIREKLYDSDCQDIPWDILVPEELIAGN